MSKPVNPETKLCGNCGPLPRTPEFFYFRADGKPWMCKRCHCARKKAQRAAAKGLLPPVPPKPKPAPKPKPPTLPTSLRSRQPGEIKLGRIGLAQQVAAQITLGIYPKSEKIRPAIRIKANGRFRTVSSKFSSVTQFSLLLATREARSVLDLPGAQVVSYGFAIPSLGKHVWIPDERPTLAQLREAQLIVTALRQRIRADDAANDDDNSVEVEDTDADDSGLTSPNGSDGDE